MQRNSLTQRYAKLGLQVPRLMLPRRDLDYRSWAVIACDQFTSKPDYWESVESAVGDSPSTLRLMLPECYLGEPDVTTRVSAIHETMNRFLADGTLGEIGEGFVLVERRTLGGVPRWGLLATIDLEQYDYRPGSKALIRATEGTIPERIPPRTNVRRGAPLEVSHVLVLYDDPDNEILGEPLSRLKELKRLYDVELMMGSGRVIGYHLAAEDLLERVVEGFERLADPKRFSQRHRTKDVLLFAVGDGNHSLAAAKTVWEETKNALKLPPNSAHPGRYALVELINIHDRALQFEPIHRVLFRRGREFLRAIASSPHLSFRRIEDFSQMMGEASEQTLGQRVGVVSGEEIGVIEFGAPTSSLAAGTFQPLLDHFLEGNSGAAVDYIHGTESTLGLGRDPNNAAFFLPALAKSEFFSTIVRDGCFPRKTFSMGEAEEKRFYLEARRILPP